MNGNPNGLTFKLHCPSEEQLADSLGTAVDLVMATARRNPIVQADIDATKRLLYAA